MVCLQMQLAILFQLAGGAKGGETEEVCVQSSETDDVPSWGVQAHFPMDGKQRPQ